LSETAVVFVRLYPLSDTLSATDMVKQKALDAKYVLA